MAAFGGTATTASTATCLCQWPSTVLINGRCIYCNHPATWTHGGNFPTPDLDPDPRPGPEPPPRKGFRQKKRSPRPEPPPSFTERLLAKLDEGISPSQVRQARQYTRRRRTHRTQRR